MTGSPADRPADLTVIGAGPAGLACAVTAAERGLRVVLVDAGIRPGGQFWRHGAEHSASAQGHGHHDWRTFLELRARLERAEEEGMLRYLPGTHAWMAERTADGFETRTVPTTNAGGPPMVTGLIASAQLAVCAGGYDRQLPVPGWELPGVMAAGGVQAFVKTNGFVPGSRTVVAGTGPFLLSVAAGAARAGGNVAAVCEANPPSRWLRHLRHAAGAPGKALEGAEYAAVFAAHRIPYRIRTIVTRALGTTRLEAVETARLDRHGRIVAGSRRRMACDLLALGWGFTPSLELLLALGAETHVDADGSLVCRTDDRGGTSVPGLFAAGEVTGIGGAALALEEGTGVGLAASRGRLPAGSLRRRERLRGFARGMHHAYPVPSGWRETVTDDTIVCRCEEVTAGEIAYAAGELAGDDARSVKSFTRAGMGWCQGRECGFGVTCLNARDPMAPDAPGLRAMQRRPLAAPLTLGALSSMDLGSTDREGTDPGAMATTRHSTETTQEEEPR